MTPKSGVERKLQFLFYGEEESMAKKQFVPDPMELEEAPTANICEICERDLDLKPHAEWEAEDCREEAAALKKAGLPPTASFLNPRYKGRERGIDLA